MLTPRSIPGELVSPRILHHAPSCYILVTMRAATVLDVVLARRRYPTLSRHDRRSHSREASSAAYGWNSNLSDEEILEKLLALNLKRSKKEVV
jgi:hypothetical protein